MNFEDQPNLQNNLDGSIVGEIEINKVINNVLSTYPRTSSFVEEAYFIKELEEIRAKVIEKQKQISREDFYKNGYKHEGQLRVEYDRHSRKLSIPKLNFLTGKEKTSLSKGELISAMDWEMDFYLDPETFVRGGLSDKLSKDFYHQYLSTWIEKKTLELLNKFIVEKEIENNEKKDTLKKIAYEGIKNREGKKIDELSMGIIAEKIIKSFLTRISIDKPGLEIELIETNAYQDADEKIDFIIRAKNKNNRGVKVGLLSENEDDVVETKIQFTINNDRRKIETKHGQLELRDVILVEMPGPEISKAFNIWTKERHKNLSTPDQYLSPEMQKMIYEKMLDSIAHKQN